MLLSPTALPQSPQDAAKAPARDTGPNPGVSLKITPKRRAGCPTASVASTSRSRGWPLTAVHVDPLTGFPFSGSVSGWETVLVIICRCLETSQARNHTPPPGGSALTYGHSRPEKSTDSRSKCLGYTALHEDRGPPSHHQVQRDRVRRRDACPGHDSPRVRQYPRRSLEATVAKPCQSFPHTCL